MSRQQTDPEDTRLQEIAIIGAGCAGLSLARRLCLQKIGPVRLYGPLSGAATNGHSWGFWATDGLEEQAGMAAQHWSKWQIITPAQKITQTAERHRYCRLDSRVWLNRCLNTINGQVERDTEGQPEPDHKLVFDSRPPEIPDGAMLQHFRGVEIETKTPCFDPETAILMDFRCDQSRGIHFLYLLPYSRTEALVESTMFSAEQQDDAFYDDSIAAYLDAYWPTGGYDIRHTEAGCIPMAFVRPGAPDYLAIGANGGCVRPSSGYAFCFIQKQTDAIAAHLAAGRTALSPASLPRPISRFDLFLDRVFLRVIRRHPELAPELFSRIAATLSGDEFARFMSGLADFRTYAKLITAMPTGPFVRALWDSDQPETKRPA